jgi:hypothetical protein
LKVSQLNSMFMEFGMGLLGRIANRSRGQRFIRAWAEKRGIKDGDWATVTTRRDDLTIRAMVVKTIRPDTVFIPYHWAGTRSANRLTHRTLDPRSKIPEFKVSACRITRANGPDPSPDDRDPHVGGASRGASSVRLRVLHRPVALHRLPLLLAGLRGMRNAPRQVDDQLRFHWNVARASAPLPMCVGNAMNPPVHRFVRPTRSRKVKMGLSIPL